MKWTIRQICENIAKDIPTVTEEELLKHSKNMALNISISHRYIRTKNEPILNNPKV